MKTRIGLKEGFFSIHSDNLEDSILSNSHEEKRQEKHQEYINDILVTVISAISAVVSLTMLISVFKFTHINESTSFPKGMLIIIFTVVAAVLFITSLALLLASTIKLVKSKYRKGHYDYITDNQLFFKYNQTRFKNDLNKIIIDTTDKKVYRLYELIDLMKPITKKNRFENNNGMTYTMRFKDQALGHELVLIDDQSKDHDILESKANTALSTKLSMQFMYNVAMLIRYQQQKEELDKSAKVAKKYEDFTSYEGDSQLDSDNQLRKDIDEQSAKQQDLYAKQQQIIKDHMERYNS